MLPGISPGLRGAAAIQLLEPRRLLAITAQIVANQLQVTGSDEAEAIVFAINGTSGQIEVTSGPQTLAFDPGDFTSVVVNALDGDDQVDAGVLDVPATLDGGLGMDRLTGGSAGDALFGREEPDILVGGDGDDTLDGGGKEDALNGGNGNDLLLGSAGLDTLDGGSGSDTLDGGSGESDLASYAARSEDLNLSLDGVANDGAAGENDQLLDIEDVTGGSGNDSITGSGKANVIRDTGGIDTVRGLGGKDNLGGESVDGGSGDDSLGGSNGTLFGAGGNDRFDGSSGNHLMQGGSGDDTFFSVPFGVNTMLGEAGNDRFSGIAYEPGSVLDGGSGDDTWEQGNSFQTIQFLGQAGDDTVEAEFSPNPGFCVFSGGSGFDHLTIVADAGGTNVFQVTLDNVANDGDPGGGTDIRSDWEHIFGYFYEQRPGTPEGDMRLDASMLNKGVTLEAGNGADTLIGGSAGDLLIGGAGNDSLVGNAGEDVLRGRHGNDRLIGGPGPDSFNGGPGDDFMDADDGEIDLVNGSSGSDTAEIDEGIDVVSEVEATS